MGRRRGAGVAAMIGHRRSRWAACARLGPFACLYVLVTAFAVSLAPGAVQAHDGAPTSFASVHVAGVRVLYSLTTSGQASPASADRGDGAQRDFRPGAPALAGEDPLRMAALIARKLRIEADGERCVAGAADFEPPTPPRQSPTFNVEFFCPRPVKVLRLTDDLFDVLGQGSHTLLRVTAEGRDEPVASAVLLADESRVGQFEIGQSVADEDGASGADRPQSVDASADHATPSVLGFLPLGVRHILEGWDHLLFLLALVLPGGSLGSLVRIVTAFTIAHSITLAAAALDWVSPPVAPVEALIALSIAWVAAENLSRMRPMSRRWLVAFAFGLIHGFGFSNVLREIGLPRDALLPALLSFNIGIELGQLLVVALLLPALAWLRGNTLGRQVPQAASAVVLAAGIVLFVQRL